ncbi:MAG: type I DNA topoisomerase [Candidatus Eisenbacteria bacterium]|nr:type I DNA topoisomerase [Candidatus Eisenbacteria bacterium]
MAKSLVIVESPAKARTINKFLGRAFTVKASMGHVKDLPKRELGVDLENSFEPRYIVIRGKGKVLKEIKKAAAGADRIFLAPDFDREGEAIAAHLAEYLKNGNGDTEIHRILFNEITEKAIKEAIRRPLPIDLQKVNAQQARRVLDRLVGYLVSPLLWKAVYRGTSAGRVQTVALRMIVEREEEIEAFVQEEYWTIDASFTGDAGEPFTASLAEMDGEKPKIEKGEEAERIVAAVKEQEYVASKVEKKVRRRKPAPPFITSTLQQEAAKRFHYSARKTMQIAQTLYEGVDMPGEGPVGLITYMRTDSTRVAQEAIDDVRRHIGEAYGAGELPDKPNEYKKGKGAQDAHEAIRPTAVSRTPESLKDHLTRDQYRIYDLIWSRFTASQMMPAVYDQTTLSLTGGPFVFRATGSVIRKKGFLLVFQESSGNGEGEGNGNGKDRLLPRVEEGEKLALGEVEPEQHFTQPPPRYSDASLVKELEANGIGRPSTYANIASTLTDRKYMERKSGRFYPTDLGRHVLKFLLINFENIFNVKFTARMESELDRVEAGEDSWQDVVDSFYQRFRKDLETVEDKSAEVMKELKSETGIECEKCGKPMIERWGRNGRFLACSGYPECRNTKPINGEEPEPTGETCEKCGGEMIVKTGRFGRFLACSNYPECKSTRSIPVGVPCPEEGCGGQLTEKRTKNGRVFYGCSRYPDCKFAVWNRPVAEKCAACGHPLLLEKRTKAQGDFLECPQCKARKEAAPEKA